MSRWHPLTVLLFAAALFEACTKQGSEHPPDQGVVDFWQPPFADAAPPDAPVHFSCEKSCLGEAAYLCVTDTKTGKCVECLADGHCKVNPAALGPRCDLTTYNCVCDQASDCAGNSNGLDCTGSRLCGCSADTQCQAPRKCVGLLAGGARVCAEPCKADADCDTTTAPACDKLSGACVACTQDKHCPAATPRCDSTTRSCKACLGADDCKASGNGAVCTGGACTCKGDADCAASTYPWGPRCVSLATSTQVRCGCGGDTDCAANPHGPTCFSLYEKCSCAADADCVDVKHPTCGLPYAGAVYKHCQASCTADADCGEKTLPKCHKSSGRCVACYADGDCASKAKPKCDKGVGHCVACLSTADCSKSPYPYCLATKGECVTCTADAHCSVPSKPYCSAGVGKCVQCKSATDCTKETFAKVCNPASGCVECLKDADCTKDTPGNTCGNAFICYCTTSADCAVNTNGKICDATARICTCLKDTDCPSGKTCSKAFAGAKICD
jgi:hypothetical protein